MKTPKFETNRAAARDYLTESRHGRLAAVPTWLGTGADTYAGETGWEPRMWLHPLYSSGAVFAAGQLVHQGIEHGVLDSPWSWLGAAGFTALCSSVAGGVSAVAGLLSVAGDRFTGWAQAYMTGGPLVAGAYLTNVALTSPYSTHSLYWAAAGTAVGMGMYRKMRDEQDHHEARYARRFALVTKRPDEPAPAPVLIPEPRDEDREQWNAAFDSVGLKGCRFAKRVDTPAGFAVLVRLPSTGKVGGDTVAAKLAALEMALGMFKDCLEYDVAVDPATGRELSNRCWIHVDVEDILTQTLHMPDDDADHTPMSVNNAFRVGTFMDGTAMTLRLREISALIVGVRGRGKTNLFHVIVHQLSRCIDVVLWAIDLKGGRAVKPWLKPWLDEKVARPVFDWVATTRSEAWLMMNAAEALINQRGNQGRGGSKITPSAEQPAVVVLVDELAALVGRHSGPKFPPKQGPDAWRNPTSQTVAAKLTLCIQLGRSEAVDFVLFTQRGTVSMVGGGDLKSQCEMRIGLGVTNPTDANSVFTNNAINAKKLRKLKNQRTRGSGLIENGQDPNHLCGKFYFYGDDTAMVNRIDRAATLHAMYPATLDMPGQQAIEQALRELTDEDCGYGVGDDAAADERWSELRAAHLYTDSLDPEWRDDDPSDGEHLGGQRDATSDGPTPPRGGTAVATRPTTTAPQQRHLRSVPATDTEASGSRYYLSRAERRRIESEQTGEQPPSGAATPPTAATPPARSADPDAERFQAEFDDLARLFDSTEAAEPTYDPSSPEQATRYDLVVQVVRDAGARGMRAGEIMAALTKMGQAWKNRQDMYPTIKKALESGHLVQPLRNGSYYTPGNQPGA